MTGVSKTVHVTYRLDSMLKAWVELDAAVRGLTPDEIVTQALLEYARRITNEEMSKNG